MNWFRCYHGISNDPKLAVVAARAKTKPGEVLAVWMCLLDYASQSETRGNAGNAGNEEIAVSTGFTVQTVDAILAALRAKGIVSEDGQLTAWERRQPAYGRATPDLSTDRVRAFREKKRKETNGNEVKHSETAGNAEKQLEERRGEESIEEKKNELTTAPKPFPIPEWALLAVAVRRSFPQTDDVFVMRLAQACCSVAAGVDGNCTDQLAAEAVEHCRAAANGSQTGAGLFLRTVPQTVKTWLTNGKSAPTRKRSTLEIITEEVCRKSS